MEISERKQKTAFVLAGPPGCGKSTWIRNVMNPDIDTHISRDAIRFSLLEDGQEYFEVEDKVKKFYYQQIKDCTSDDFTNDCVFIDATHLTRKSRAQTCSWIRKNPYKIAVSFEVPLNIALERNAQRTGRAKVPETVIHNMYRAFEKPTLKEGFDEVWHVDAEGVITKEVRNYE